jgi:hypothetical protein
VIADGPRTCYQCSTTFEFAEGYPVEIRWSAAPCEGCERWAGIWERAKLLRDVEAAKVEAKPAAVDLNDFGAILARLRGDTQPAPVYDFARAAANDRE